MLLQSLSSNATPVNAKVEKDLTTTRKAQLSNHKEMKNKFGI